MKHLAYLLIALVGTVASAQSFQGMAVYESKTATPDISGMGGPGRPEITPEMKKMIQDRMKQALERTYILTFDKTSSTYLEEEKLDAPGQDNGGMRIMASFMGGGGKQYKNVKTKRFLQEKEVFGKEFLIDDSLPKLAWKMENETKKIGDYTCYKATAVVDASKSDFRNFKPKSPEEQKAAAEKLEKAKKEGNEKRTNFLEQMEMPKQVTITAWYTPDIPVSQGPENYWGLPGLILEVSNGKTTVLCSKVVINSKEKTEVKIPSKGKKVTQVEYDEIVMKKMQEMQEMYQQGGGAGPTIRIN
ncbi:GLPGLI family protein [Flavobacterium sp. Sd200]|uniref:GLPGLI family protein n=1 Tax=Flavobacterium sp. Sd200 TaxID=2692211 RepID=UPI001369DB8A|nr:GLPGLI family protein [Flavobacterium sp. Sd200]MXN91767.1 GLPGLI family protein [Flavobacterium sp. Sd200]